MRITHTLKKALAGATGVALALLVGGASASAQVSNAQGVSQSSLPSQNAAVSNDNTDTAGAASTTNTTSATVFGQDTQALFQTGAEDLAYGARGESVSQLQGFLAELGFLDLSGVGGPTGYYGSMTRDAVARYQAAIGVPATGYFGPLTKGSMALHFVKNNWMNNLSGVNSANPTAASVNGSASAGPDTGGAEVDFGTGPFSATNPGYYFNGVWYPNQVDMTIRAPGASTNAATSAMGSSPANSADASSTGATGDTGTAGSADNSSNTGGSSNTSDSGSSGNLDYTSAP